MMVYNSFPMTPTAIFIGLILFLAPNIVFAKVRTNIKVNTSTGENYINGVKVTESSKTNINLHSTGDGSTQLIVNNDKFEISGVINWVGDSSFKVSDQEVFIDSNLASSLKNQGILKVGERVTVKGDSSNGKLIATEVNGAGTSNNSSTPTSTPTSTHSPTPTLTTGPGTPTLTPIEASPTATLTPSPGDIQDEITKGIISQIIDSLENFVDQLKNLL